MAGTFPDVPSRRMAYDDDGTVGLWSIYDKLEVLAGRTYLWNAITSGQLAIFNNEDELTGPGFWGDVFNMALIFPELREIDGLYVESVYLDNTSGEKWEVNVSSNSTWGGNGTWVNVIPKGTAARGTTLNHRNDIISMAQTGRRAIEIGSGNGGSGGGNDLFVVHVYGEISAGQTPDRLLYIDELTGVEFGLPIDFGDIPRGSSEDRELRLRNNSASLTINTISYTAEALYRSSASWYTFTAPGGSTFAASQNLASLASATTSALITARRITPSGAGLGLHSARIETTHASLT